MHKAISALIVLSLSCTFAFADAGKGDITFNLRKADPVVFSHDYHTKARGVKCSACHFQTFSASGTYHMKKDKMNKRDFCEHCHNGMKGFDARSEKNCARCHKK